MSQRRGVRRGDQKLADDRLHDGGGRYLDHLSVGAVAEVVQIGALEVQMGVAVEVYRGIDDKRCEAAVPAEKMNHALGSFALQSEGRCEENVLHGNGKLPNTTSSLGYSLKAAGIQRCRILRIASTCSWPPQRWRSNQNSL